jgi:hypothetical protein
MNGWQGLIGATIEMDLANHLRRPKADLVLYLFCLVCFPKPPSMIDSRGQQYDGWLHLFYIMLEALNKT